LNLPRDGLLLRVFIGESDRWGGLPLYETIVQEARKHGLAGATVFRGFEGFGAHSRIHTTKILQLSQDLPIVIEIVDAEDKIQAFLPVLEEMVKEGLATIEKATVIFYRAGSTTPPTDRNE
jgi:PII-like signaling protein